MTKDEVLKLVRDEIEGINCGVNYSGRFNDVLQKIDEALAQPEQEPVAMRYDFDGYGWKYIDKGSGSDWKTRIKDAEPVYTSPQPQRKPLTNGYYVMHINGSTENIFPLNEDQALALALVETQSQPQPEREPVVCDTAPENSLPTWLECARIVENDKFRKRAEAGLEGQVLDTPRTTPTPTALHYFIHEYDDADPDRSAWFLHRLECVLKEVTTQPQRKPLTDEQIIASNYPDGEEDGSIIAAPDFELICFARQIEAIHNIKEST